MGVIPALAGGSIPIHTLPDLPGRAADAVPGGADGGGGKTQRRSLKWQ